MLLQLCPVLDGRKQGVLPTRARPIPDVQVELDHLLCMQVAAEDLDQHVRLGSRRRRHSKISDGLNLSNVALALRLYALWPSSNTIIGRSTRRVLPSDVLTCRPQKPPPSKVSRVGTRSSKARWPAAASSAGKKRRTAAVAEHTKLLLGFTVRGREHQQQDAQTVCHVGRTEAAGLLQHHGPASGCEVELLAYGWSRSFRAASVCR